MLFLNKITYGPHGNELIEKYKNYQQLLCLPGFIVHLSITTHCKKIYIKINVHVTEAKFKASTLNKNINLMWI